MDRDCGTWLSINIMIYDCTKTMQEKYNENWLYVHREVFMLKKLMKSTKYNKIQLSSNKSDNCASLTIIASCLSANLSKKRKKIGWKKRRIDQKLSTHSKRWKVLVRNEERPRIHRDIPGRRQRKKLASVLQFLRNTYRVLTWIQKLGSRFGWVSSCAQALRALTSTTTAALSSVSNRWVKQTQDIGSVLCILR